MRLFVFFVCLVASFPALSQDLTGIWRGHFNSETGNRLLDSLNTTDRYKFEVQLDQEGKTFNGVTYSYKTTVFYGKASATGAINKQTRKVILQETKITEVRSLGGGACIMTCFLQYSKVGKEEFLEGHYTGISVQDSSYCGKGTVFLRKVTTSDFYKEPFLVEKENKKPPPATIAPRKQPAPPVTTPKKPTAPVTAAPKKSPAPATTAPKKTAPPVRKPDVVKTPEKPRLAPPPAQPSLPKKSEELTPIPKDSLENLIGQVNPAVPVPQVIRSRKNEIVRTITTSAKEIYIKIYDNGSIDNDTVSVYVDNKQVVANQRLTEKPIVVKLTLGEKNQLHELVMVAENLGEIPPNTSLMVVHAGDEIYEVRITSTEQKNAVVMFRYEN